MHTDEQLMEQYLDGDHGAFAVLHARYEPIVRRLVTRNVFQRAEVDDLVQQTFTQLHAFRAGFRRGERLKPWVCTVARNVCRDHGRRTKRRPEVGRDMDDLSVDEPTLLPGELNQQRAPLAAALASLSDPTRTIFQQHFLEERPLVDIAHDLETNPSTVRVRLHRGFHQLRAAMAG
jgi:RNA polymerase sigma factor (sigma-70 family)